KYHLAAQVLGEVLALEPEDLTALKRLGSAYFALGRREQAAAAWNSALKLAPEAPQLLKFLKKLDGPARPSAESSPEPPGPKESE
ncbi:MAG: tetratricopeptide repeat protein, partial [Elusimicrobiota bacterium]